jgi:hypothetical protein
MKDITPNYNEKIIGLVILSVMVAAIVSVGGLQFVTITISLILLGLFSIYLYSIKTGTWPFSALKVIVNILFNPFYLLLLIKSWTMLDYKDQFEEIDKKLKENGKLNQ